MNPVRSKLLILAQPAAPDAKRPFCTWCGERIVFSDLANGRHKQRTRHRGDKYEARNSILARKRNCNREFKQSMVWSGQDAIRWRQSQVEERDGDGYVIKCEGCGDLCETGRPSTSPRHGFKVRSKRVHKRWEADHIKELADGGKHLLENLQALCVSCHVVKTQKERTRRILKKAKRELEGVCHGFGG